MSYQHLNQPGHRLLPRQHNFNSPEIFEEPDSFIETVNFSESDGYIDILPKVRSVPSHDIQELYIRKPLLSSSQLLPCAPQSSRCCHWAAQPESMYEHSPIQYAFATGQAIPRRSSTAYVAHRNVSSVPNNLTAIRNRIHQDNIFSDQASFKSAPTIAAGVSHKTSEEGRGLLRNKLPGSMTYRASRSMRQVVPSTTLKKQSNFFERPPRQSSVDSKKRPMKCPIPLGVSKSQEIRLPLQTQPNSFNCRTMPEMSNVNPMIDVRKMNSEGDATGYVPNINNLDTIQRIVASLDENEIEKLSEGHKNEIRKLSKFLAPRVPNSVKSTTRNQKARNPSDHKTVNKDENDTNSADKPKVSLKKSLSNILDQLENCELFLNAVRAKYSADRDKALNVGNKEELKSKEIFNFREISAKISTIPDGEIINEMKEEENISPVNKFSSQEILDSIQSHESNKNLSDSIDKKDSKNSLDDMDALQLHRSKSYIVNLIDRALSKELGTMTEESLERNKEELQDLSTAKAINHIKRNYKLDKNDHGTMGVLTNQEINLIFSPTNLENQSALKKDNQPPYIKQLKELRWGHFRHIQQEVRRLEDLERFLDNCGNPCDTSKDLYDNENK